MVNFRFDTVGNPPHSGRGGTYAYMDIAQEPVLQCSAELLTQEPLHRTLVVHAAHPPERQTSLPGSSVPR